NTAIPQATRGRPPSSAHSLSSPMREDDPAPTMMPATPLNRAPVSAQRGHRPLGLAHMLSRPQANLFGLQARKNHAPGRRLNDLRHADFHHTVEMRPSVFHDDHGP